MNMNPKLVMTARFAGLAMQEYIRAGTDADVVGAYAWRAAEQMMEAMPAHLRKMLEDAQHRYLSNSVNVLVTGEGREGSVLVEKVAGEAG